MSLVSLCLGFLVFGMLMIVNRHQADPIGLSGDPPLMTDREYARVPLRAPTIYLALPLICAHWAILRRWAEPHYAASYGLMPARHGGSIHAQGFRGARGMRFLFRTGLPGSER
jgi:hypothetical protein